MNNITRIIVYSEYYSQITTLQETYSLGNSEAIALLLLQERWPWNNNTMHILWFFHFHSNKNRSDSISLLSHYFSTQSLPRLRRSSYRRTSFSHPSRQLSCPASSPNVTQLFPLPDRGHQDFASTLDKENRSTPCFQTTALFFLWQWVPWSKRKWVMTHMSNITGVFIKQMCTQNLIPVVFVYIIAILSKLGIWSYARNEWKVTHNCEWGNAENKQRNVSVGIGVPVYHACNSH